MEELKCPNCGKFFQVDDAGYAAIARQIRDKEFHKDLDERAKSLKDAQAKDAEILQAFEFSPRPDKCDQRVDFRRLRINLGLVIAIIHIPVKGNERSVFSNGILPVQPGDGVPVPGLIAALPEGKSRAVDIMDGAAIQGDPVCLPEGSPALGAIEDLRIVYHDGRAVIRIDAEDTASVETAGTDVDHGAVLEEQHTPGTLSRLPCMTRSKVQTPDIVTVLEGQNICITGCCRDHIVQCRL